MPLAVDDVGSYLLGTWRVSRDIEGEQAPSAGFFGGTATFVFDGTAVQWIEQGELEIVGNRGTAGRLLRVVVDPTRRFAADVYYDDGRYFHPIDISAGVSTFSYDCAPDFYRGQLTVESPDEWRLAWDIEGPTKRYTITSIYRRVPTTDA
jgi:hypothetical protein